MTCTTKAGAQTLSVCLNGADAVYRYGPTKGTPDLEIAAPIRSVGYMPWPGIGRNIWESVTFTNNGYSYEVFTGFDRAVGDGEEDTSQVYGSVSVRKGDDEIAALICDAGSVEWSYGGGLYDAKTALGLCWQHWPENQWQPCPKE